MFHDADAVEAPVDGKGIADGHQRAGVEGDDVVEGKEAPEHAGPVDVPGRLRMASFPREPKPVRMRGGALGGTPLPHDVAEALRAHVERRGETGFASGLPAQNGVVPSEPRGVAARGGCDGWHSEAVPWKESSRGQRGASVTQAFRVGAPLTGEGEYPCRDGPPLTVGDGRGSLDEPKVDRVGRERQGPDSQCSWKVAVRAVPRDSGIPAAHERAGGGGARTPQPLCGSLGGNDLSLIAGEW